MNRLLLFVGLVVVGGCTAEREIAGKAEWLCERAVFSQEAAGALPLLLGISKDEASEYVVEGELPDRAPQRLPSRSLLGSRFGERAEELFRAVPAVTECTIRDMRIDGRLAVVSLVREWPDTNQLGHDLQLDDLPADARTRYLVTLLREVESRESRHHTLTFIQTASGWRASFLTEREPTPCEQKVRALESELKQFADNVPTVHPDFAHRIPTRTQGLPLAEEEATIITLVGTELLVDDQPVTRVGAPGWKKAFGQKWLESREHMERVAELSSRAPPTHLYLLVSLDTEEPTKRRVLRALPSGFEVRQVFRRPRVDHKIPKISKPFRDLLRKRARAKETEPYQLRLRFFELVGTSCPNLAEHGQSAMGGPPDIAAKTFVAIAVLGLEECGCGYESTEDIVAFAGLENGTFWVDEAGDLVVGDQLVYE